MYDLSSAETYVVYLPLLGDILSAGNLFLRHVIPELMPEKITAEGPERLIPISEGRLFMNVSFDDPIQMLPVVPRRLRSVQSFGSGFMLVSS